MNILDTQVVMEDWYQTDSSLIEAASKSLEALLEENNWKTVSLPISEYGDDILTVKCRIPADAQRNKGNVAGYTIFINGKKVNACKSFEALIRAIHAELEFSIRNATGTVTGLITVQLPKFVELDKATTAAEKIAVAQLKETRKDLFVGEEVRLVRTDLNKQNYLKSSNPLQAIYSDLLNNAFTIEVYTKDTNSCIGLLDPNNKLTPLISRALVLHTPIFAKVSKVPRDVQRVTATGVAGSHEKSSTVKISVEILR